MGLIRLLCLIATVLLYSVSSQADEWIIEEQENYITLKKNGEIAHGNNIYFNFQKEGCVMNIFFFLYTMQENIPNLMEVYADKAFQVILGGEEIQANLNYSTPFGLGQIAGIYLARELPLSEGFIEYNENILQDNLMIIKIPEPHSQYFDIPQENWDFTDIRSKLYEAHNTCIAKQI